MALYNWLAGIHVNIQFYVNDQLVTLKKTANGTPYFNIVSLNYTVKDYPMPNSDGTPVSGARGTYTHTEKAQLTTAVTGYNLNGSTVMLLNTQIMSHMLIMIMMKLKLPMEWLVGMVRMVGIILAVKMKLLVLQLIR